MVFQFFILCLVFLVYQVGCVTITKVSKVHTLTLAPPQEAWGSNIYWTLDLDGGG